MANFKVNPNVVAQRVEDQVVVVNLETNGIFALSPTAARLWELLSEGRNPADIHEALSREYAISDPDLKQEIDDLLAELKAESLIEPRDDD